MADVRTFKTPILLLIFNRPETTKAVFESIRSVRPAEYYVAADGPRTLVEGEAARCIEARRMATAVDWECSVHTLFRSQNLGGGVGVVSAISWFLGQVDEGIILEDDCVASRSFYAFCEVLLACYRHNEIVMHISGHNFQYGRRRGDASYYFSKWTHSGGWATWRRAWQHYDFSLIPAATRKDVWDGQWMLSVEKRHGVAILPNVNLVTNIGYGPGASHTQGLARPGFLPARDINFPLRHPRKIRIDRSADTFTYYANIRNVPSLRLIWGYRILDFLALVPVRVRKLIRKMSRAL